MKSSPEILDSSTCRNEINSVEKGSVNQILSTQDVEKLCTCTLNSLMHFRKWLLIKESRSGKRCGNLLIIHRPTISKQLKFYDPLNDVTLQKGNIFTSQGEFWHSRRSTFGPYLSDANAQRMNEIASTKAEDEWIATKLAKCISDDKAFDVGEEMVKLPLISREKIHRRSASFITHQLQNPGKRTKVGNQKTPKPTKLIRMRSLTYQVIHESKQTQNFTTIMQRKGEHFKEITDGLCFATNK